MVSNFKVSKLLNKKGSNIICNTLKFLQFLRNTDHWKYLKKKADLLSPWSKCKVNVLHSLRNAWQKFLGAQSRPISWNRLSLILSCSPERIWLVSPTCSMKISFYSLTTIPEVSGILSVGKYSLKSESAEYSIKLVVTFDIWLLAPYMATNSPPALYLLDTVLFILSWKCMSRNTSRNGAEEGILTKSLRLPKRSSHLSI